MRLSRALVGLLLWFSIGFPSLLPAQAEETGYEYQRYRVRVAVGFSRDFRLTKKFRRQVLTDLQAALARSTAGQWDLSVEETMEIAPANRLGLQRFDKTDFRRDDLEDLAEDEQAPPVEFDKQFFLSVDVAGSKYLLAGREWDELTQEISPIIASETFHARAVPEELCRLVSESFHPLLTVEEADVGRKTVSLKLRAGGYVPESVAEDPNAEFLRAQVRPGSLLIAFFRYHNENGTVRQVQFLPWTYLVVDSVRRGRVQATLVSGIRTPLGASTSRRVKSLAVARRARHPATTLQIQLRQNPRKKLAGHYVSATAEKYPDEENPSPELFKRVTDRKGRLDIPVHPEHDILWLRIHSGKTLLALVPFAPGLARKLVLDLPDDSIRLAVEGDLTQVRADLVDTVARRATLMIRARKAVEEEDWKTVDEEMAKLEKLPSLQEFQQRIDNIRVKATNDKDRNISRLTKNRVRRMCDTAKDLVEKYLSEERINLLKDEIRELRQNR